MASSSSPSSLPNKNTMNKKISFSYLSKKKISKSFDDDDVNNLYTKTPEKPFLPPSRSSRRHQNRSNVVMSVNEIRNAAKSLRKPKRKPDLIDLIPSSSARRQILVSGSGLDSDRPNVLSEKYKMLEENFNCLDNSIRLHRMKGLIPTFANICVSVETLTGRRFSYGHLAQLKFILPEAIVLRKVMSLDERTSCMKPDLHVSLDATAVKSDLNLKSGSGNLHMRKVFLSRLEDFVKSYPEGGDVPEGELPEPFGRVSIQPNLEATEGSSSGVVDTSASSNLVQLPAVAAHLPGAFRRHFSGKASCQDSETTLQNHAEESSPPLVLSVTAKIHGTPMKLSSTLSKPVDSTPPRPVLSSAAKIQETPTKFASTPSKLIISTPALQTPKRYVISPDDNSNKLPDKLMRRSLRTRQLNFNTPVKSTSVGDNSDILDILSEDLLSSIQEKERVIIEESDPAISQAKRRRAMVAGLPKLFNSIYLFFQAINKSVITKDELIHKICANQLDITDRGELEERVLLLQELVPEWISENLASSGDRLIRINKSLNTQLIRARLAEAQ